MRPKRLKPWITCRSSVPALRCSPPHCPFSGYSGSVMLTTSLTQSSAPPLPSPPTRPPRTHYPAARAKPPSALPHKAGTARSPNISTAKCSYFAGEKSDEPCAAPYYRRNRNGAGSVNDLIWSPTQVTDAEPEPRAPREAWPHADKSALLDFSPKRVKHPAILPNLTPPPPSLLH